MREHTVKEYHPESRTVVIRAGRMYGSQLDMLEEFYQDALKDFPNLKREECKVVQYGGMHYKGTFGIEFVVGRRCPESYVRISQLEYTK